jgi:hypothetical protein
MLVSISDAPDKATVLLRLSAPVVLVKVEW